MPEVKRVARTVKAMGGFQRMTEVLDVIKAAGGVKKFKDLAEAITATRARTTFHSECRTSEMRFD